MKSVLIITAFTISIVFLSCSDKKKDEIYPTDVNNVTVDDSVDDFVDDSVDSFLPTDDDLSDDMPIDNEQDESVIDEDEVEDVDKVFPDTEVEDLDDDSDADLVDMDIPEVDEDQIDFCFQKICKDHTGCSGSACESDGASYACAPEIEDFGYRNTGECVEINCGKDSDCRLELGYICVDFGLVSPDFNNGESACMKSVIGEPCSQDGKKICQFDRNIALECKEGIWTPDFCNSGEVCSAGECIVETSDSDVELPDDDTEPVLEICDNIDNNGNSQIDEGCDDDGDGWCDINMVVFGTPTVCPNGVLDCNDGDNTIYPGSTIHKEGVDYDCDNRKEYQATVILSVDDELVDLCANGNNVATFGAHYGQWPYADTYNGEELVLESGINVVGVHGKDTGAAISAFVATVQVNGQLFISDGVLPPVSGIAYTSLDSEWTQSDWRYFPTMAAGPNGDWCDKWFDDSAWGPAIKAGKTGTLDSVWGNLGTNPWYGGACGLSMSGRCPTAFESYYVDSVLGNEPKWIWDYNPTSLADAWLRIKIVLP